VSDDDDASADGSYSQIADAQIDELEAGPDLTLYNAVLEVCELIFNSPDQAQSESAAITTENGIRFRVAVSGHYPYKVFWSSDGPRIEAVFPYP
jgi:hypothetical protein